MSTGGQNDVIVIGGGHNGLVAACYLAAAGLKPLVLEAQASIGGMATTEFSIPGAPEHMVHPCALDLFLMRASTVIEDLRLGELGFQQVDVDPAYVFLDREGASIAFWRDPRLTAAEIARISRKDAAAYLEFHETLEPAVSVGAAFLAVNPTRPPLGLVGRAAANVLRAPRRWRRTVELLATAPEQTLQERFEHPMVRDALGAIVGQAGPLKSAQNGLSFIMLPFVQAFGVGRPIGGMHTLIQAMVRRLELSGGSVRTSAPVEEILIQGQRAVGVRLADGEEIRAGRAVVSACDPRVTLDRLVAPDKLPDAMVRRVRRMPANADGTGDLKVDVAVSGRIGLSRHEKWRGDGLDLRHPTALAGTIEDFNRAYALSAAGLLPEQIPAWVTVPSAADPSQAPDGQDTVYMYSGAVPVHPAEPLEEYRERAGKAFISTVGAYYEGLESMEIGRRVATSADLASRYNATNGCILHVDWALSRVGPLRPALGLGGYRTPVERLYLSSCGSHPGAGVGGFAGQNAARTVLRELRRVDRTK